MISLLTVAGYCAAFTACFLAPTAVVAIRDRWRRR